MKIESKFNIIYKGDIYNQLISFVKKNNFSKVIVIIDKNIIKLRYTKKILKKLRFYLNIKKTYLYYEPNEPSYQHLDKEKKKFFSSNKLKCDLFISIGGGSTIDFAKGLAVVCKNKGRAIKYMGFPDLKIKPIPVIAVPTNCSTGSEVTFNAVFIDLDKGKKLGINSKFNYPILSVYDSNFISFSPKQLIYFSAGATLMRSIETFVAKDSNIITKIFSKKSFELIVNNLGTVMKNKNKKKECLNLQLGCLFSMQALSNAGGGPAGILTYMLSTKFNLPQAWTYTIVGLEFFKKNISLGYYEYDKIIENNHFDKKLIKIIKKIENLDPIRKNGDKNLKDYLLYADTINDTLMGKKAILDNRNPIKYKLKDIRDLSNKIAFKLTKYF